jgi:hypothetical protein
VTSAADPSPLPAENAASETATVTAESPGHGPNYRLTRKQGGKTVTETFSSPAELRKAQSEVEAFHRFQSLSRELLEVNEKICMARPVEDTLVPQEKKFAQAVHFEVQREVDRILQVLFQSQRKEGRFDLESAETAMRASMHRAASGRLDPNSAVPTTGLAAVPSLFVRQPGPVQGATLQTNPDHCRARDPDASLLPLLRLPCWAVSG